MIRRVLAAAAAAVAIVATSPGAASAAKPPTTWDNLVLVPSKRLDLVYLLPGADFRSYSKVMLDPTEVAFKKNWLRDYNTSSMGRMARLDESDMQRVMDAVRTEFGDIMAKACREAGYEVVQAPGPDVLRIRTGVLNLSVSAPDVPTAGRSRTFAQEAGEATLMVEVRDSQTNALLGRAVDRRIAGDTSAFLRNSVTNRSDFRRLFQLWAKAGVNGLTQLKTLSPIGAAAAGGD